jgi:hypothetical protein
MKRRGQLWPIVACALCLCEFGVMALLIGQQITAAAVIS